MEDEASVIPVVDGKPLLLAGLTIVSLPFSLQEKTGYREPKGSWGFVGRPEEVGAVN